MFVYTQNCVRIARAGAELWMCWCYEYKTMNATACAGTGAANAYTKCDIEHPFPGTQMFEQARKKSPQQSPNQVEDTVHVCYRKFTRTLLENT